MSFWRLIKIICQIDGLQRRPTKKELDYIASVSNTRSENKLVVQQFSLLSVSLDLFKVPFKQLLRIIGVTVSKANEYYKL